MNRLAIYSNVARIQLCLVTEIRLATFIWLSSDFLIRLESGGR